MGPRSEPTAIRRWCRFNLVGLAGFVLQLILLAALTRLTTWPLGACVAVAVMLTVSHNFVWHTRYTWRPSGEAGLRQWAAFNVSNGLISLACNVLVTSSVAALGAPVLAANATAVAVASLANFVVADRLVFRRRVRADASSVARARAPHCDVVDLSSSATTSGEMSRLGSPQARPAAP